MELPTNGASTPLKPSLPPQLPASAPMMAPVQHEPVKVLLDAVEPGKNPRKTFDEKKLKELADSLKAKGQQSPILVRPAPLTPGSKVEPFYQLVYGERRVRAARLAGWAHITAFVREMSDREALEEALTENGAREDVDEYEEAEAFRQLRDVHKRSAEEIAAKVGKSLGTVYSRLKLAELDSKARELAQKNELPPSHALLAARIVGAERQRQAVKEIVEGRFGSSPLSYREAAAHVQQNYMLALGEAQFDTADEQLVPGAGSCAKCPKRTGNQPALFHDVKSKDVCTDSKCYGEKQKAHVQIALDKAKADGVRVMDDKQAKTVILPHSVGGGYVDADAPNYADGKVRSYRESLGKKLPPVVLAKDPNTGKLRELLPRADVEALVEQKREERKQTAADKKERARFEREQRQRDKERASEKQFRADAIAAAEKHDFGAVALRGIVLLISAVDDDATVEARNWRDDKNADADASNIVFSKVTAMGPAELRGLLVELAIDSGQYSGGNAKDALELLYVGLGIVSPNAPAKAKAKAKAKKKATVKAASKKSTTKKKSASKK